MIICQNINKINFQLYVDMVLVGFGMVISIREIVEIIEHILQ